MPDQAKPVPRTWRRFVRFSVRGLIVLVLVIGGWLGWIVRSAHIQRDAAAAIEREGGFVRYNWEYFVYDAGYGSTRIEQLYEKSWAPRWLIRLVGIDFFGHVVLAFYGARPGTRAPLQAIGSLATLKRLWLHFVNIGNDELANIKGLASLVEVDLLGSDVTDAGLAHLNGLTNLSELGLRGNPITDVGLAHLTGLTKLTTLDVRGTKITDAGAEELQQALPNLKITR